MHELTEKIWDLDRHCKFDKDHLDDLITAWIEEKVSAIRSAYNDCGRSDCDTKHIAYWYLREILGLAKEPERAEKQEDVTNEEIVKKLDSMKDEATKTVGSSQGAREYLSGLRKEAPVEAKWCEHIVWKNHEPGKFMEGWHKLYVPRPGNNYGSLVSSDLLHSDIMFCDICGKPRPEREKKLWKRLKDAAIKRMYGMCSTSKSVWNEEDHGYWPAVAEVAIKAFEEVVDRMAGEKRLHSMDANELKRRLKELAE